MSDRKIWWIIYLATAIFAAFILSSIAANAQQQTIYGPDGRAIGRATTDTQGTRTLYGSDGKALTREAPTTGGSTIYDARTGRQLGTTQQDKRK